MKAKYSINDAFRTLPEVHAAGEWLVKNGYKHLIAVKNDGWFELEYPSSVSLAESVWGEYMSEY
jgi:hypothetical protein